MKCKVLESFNVGGSKGIIKFQPDQEVILPEEIALKLITQSKIASIEKGAYWGYSDILKAYVWIAKDRKELVALRASEKISESAYTADELKMLKGIDKDEIEAIKNVKRIFELAIVQEVILGDSGK